MILRKKISATIANVSCFNRQRVRSMQHHLEVKLICVNDYLCYIKKLNKRIETLKESIDRQKSLMLPAGIDYSELVAASSSGDALENGVIKLQELIKEYCTELAEYVEQQQIAYNVFKKLSNPKGTEALTKYYLQGKTWEKVCVEMAYSYRGMMKLKKAAELEVYDYMPEQWRRYSIPNSI